MHIDDTALQEHFAFRSGETLAVCCEKIQLALGLPAFKLDSENEAAWGCAESRLVEYNVSRPFDAGTLQRWDPSVPNGCNFGFTLSASKGHPLADEPDRFAVETAQPIAQALANALGTKVFHHRSWRGPGCNVERSEVLEPDGAA